MIKLPKKSKVFVYQSPIDMRFGFERLSCFVRETNFMNIKDFDGNLRITQSELELLLHGSVLKKYLPNYR